MMEKIQSEMLLQYYFSLNSVDICTLAWAMLANVCLIGVLWTWPRSFLRAQPRHLLMKALCWWFFNGTGRNSHLWWGSVWRLIADLGSPLCRRRGISSAATRTVRSCQLFVKHGWKIRAAFLFFCRVCSRHASLQRPWSLGRVERSQVGRRAVWSAPGGSRSFLLWRTHSLCVIEKHQREHISPARGYWKNSQIIGSVDIIDTVLAEKKKFLLFFPYLEYAARSPVMELWISAHYIGQSCPRAGLLLSNPLLALIFLEALPSKRHGTLPAMH